MVQDCPGCEAERSAPATRPVPPAHSRHVRKKKSPEMGTSFHQTYRERHYNVDGGHHSTSFTLDL